MRMMMALVGIMVAVMVGEAAAAAFSIRPAVNNKDSSMRLTPEAAGAFTPDALTRESRLSARGSMNIDEGEMDEDSLREAAAAAHSRRGFLRASATSAAAVAAAAAVLYSDPAAAISGDDAEALSSSTPPQSSSLEAGGSAAIASADAATAKIPAEVDFKAILEKSAKRAVGGGKAGASAAVVQVFSLMWLRTAMNVSFFSEGIAYTLLLQKENGATLCSRSIVTKPLVSHDLANTC